jgi:hypothetical protein
MVRIDANDDRPFVFAVSQPRYVQCAGFAIAMLLVRIKLSLKFGEACKAARRFADLIKRFVTPLNWLSILNR